MPPRSAATVIPTTAPLCSSQTGEPLNPPSIRCSPAVLCSWNHRVPCSPADPTARPHALGPAIGEPQHAEAVVPQPVDPPQRRHPGLRRRGSGQPEQRDVAGAVVGDREPPLHDRFDAHGAGEQGEVERHRIGRRGTRVGVGAGRVGDHVRAGGDQPGADEEPPTDHVGARSTPSRGHRRRPRRCRTRPHNPQSPLGCSADGVPPTRPIGSGRGRSRAVVQGRSGRPWGSVGSPASITIPSMNDQIIPTPANRTSTSWAAAMPVCPV